MMQPPPEAVTTLIEKARQLIKAAFDVEPDLTQDTLPLLDGYLRTLVSTATAAERTTALEAMGAHFGEVACRTLNGQWALRGEDKGQWRVELRSCFLTFNPLGMAAEVAYGCETAEYDGSFASRDDLQDELSEMLGAAAPMSDKAYYSLSGRMDVLLLVTDWLTSNRLVEEGKKGIRPAELTANDYRVALDAGPEDAPGKSDSSKTPLN
ncbi:MAG: hypothetical protein JRH20_05565 [Deltaproteobacteria bacterium]|nr:hypothetical protein [Deltaproteobacteria bacterium]